MNLNPFGRKSRPAQARPPGIFPELSRASWGTNLGATRSYEALARDAYVRNPIAQRAVRIVAEGAAGAPVLSSPPGHPAIALLDGGEPGPHLIETVAANLLLHGNAYIEVGLGANGLPVALYSLRPERVTVESDASGWPVGYGTSIPMFIAIGENTTVVATYSIVEGNTIVGDRVNWLYDDLNLGTVAANDTESNIVLCNRFANNVVDQHSIKHDFYDDPYVKSQRGGTSLYGFDLAASRSKAKAVGAELTTGGNVYHCITAGTTASTGGPAGTTANITDGTVHWAWFASEVRQHGYVRLWNYAVGTPTDAVVTLDFDTLSGGFLLPGEADPVFAGDIDRLFISLTPAGYTGVDAPLPAAVDASVTLSDISCDGPTSTIAIGDTFVPLHRLRMATGYDDSYNLTPERLLRGIVATGYTTWLNHYVGMSHFFQVAWNPASARYEVDPSRPLCAPAAAWHRDFAARAAAAGLTLIVSQSFELLAQHAPATWNQRDATGAPALTGYAPPSTLLSPCSAPAMAWLQAVAQAFVALAVAAGHAPHFQIGEPWWWVGPDHRPCFYDAATLAAYHSEGGAPPSLLLDARGTFDARNRAFADWLGGKLGAATLALRDAVRAAAPAVTTYLLFYAPQVLLAASPELVRANLPSAWAYPAFDVLQLEDYDFVTSGNFAAQAAARAVVATRLGYPPAAQHYFAGFVARVEDRGQWPAIADAAAAAHDRGIAEVFVWAWPEVARDGFVAFDIMGDEAVAAFDDVCFPLAIGLRASGGPEFSTQISTSSSGYEQRNSSWAEARLHYDAGVGVRSEADLRLLLAFFRARRGQASGFRFTDPLDHSSGDGDTITALDQPIGIGDGVATRFALTKCYGTADDPHDRRITRPVAGSVVVAVAGAVVTGWHLADGGYVDLAAPPPAGAVVTAGFAFDVPVRFADDRLDVSAGGWRSGDAASVPLIEIREA